MAAMPTRLSDKKPRHIERGFRVTLPQLRLLLTGGGDGRAAVQSVYLRLD